MHYLYRITNQVNNKVYIGQTITPSKRWYEHKRAAVPNKNTQGMIITRAIKKYNKDNFIFEVIATCKNQEDADYIEKQLIVQYNSRNPENGYNIAIGGSDGNMLGRHHTDEAKQKIADFQKQLNQLPEVTENKRQKMLGNTNCVGRINSDETNQKKRQSMIGKNIGKKRTPEQIANMVKSRWKK